MRSTSENFSGDTTIRSSCIILLTVIRIAAYGAVIFAEARVLHYLPRAQHHTV